MDLLAFCIYVAYRFSANSVDVTAKLTIGPKEDKVEVTNLIMTIELDDINLEMECLFPSNGKCCPEKYLKSSNSIFSKTVHRYFPILKK